MATDSCFCQQLIGADKPRNLQPMVADKKNAFAKRLNEAPDAIEFPSGRGRRAALAKKMGVSGEGARKWLAGDTIPGIENAIELALIAKEEVEYLLTGRRPAKIQPTAIQARDSTKT